jgi:oxalate decarboxylase
LPVAAIQNTGKTDLAFPEMFKVDRYLDLSMNTWIRHLPQEVETAYLNIDEATLRDIRAEKQMVIAKSLFTLWRC